jgi:hypothetical protein
VIGRITADYANGVQLGDVFGDGHDLGHRLEWLTQVVLIQTRNDYPLARFRQLPADFSQVISKKLRFIDPHDIRILSQKDDLRGSSHCRGAQRGVIV